MRQLWDDYGSWADYGSRYGRLWKDYGRRVDYGSRVDYGRTAVVLSEKIDITTQHYRHYGPLWVTVASIGTTKPLLHSPDVTAPERSNFLPYVVPHYQTGWVSCEASFVFLDHHFRHLPHAPVSLVSRSEAQPDAESVAMVNAQGVGLIPGLCMMDSVDDVRLLAHDWAQENGNSNEIPRQAAEDKTKTRKIQSTLQHSPLSTYGAI
ncbi:hypothetical protein EDB92DRAFT_1821974 [Lactarius akahatsu]|uniref:Uncharacterized protein n=1 Tax=Lactarius akahatsu TaxID=416441 RepID=A0AAD4Q2B7_9AGAM|nr:hypothetical protein EDB92DRAFT_1821974 [Lactarius akahatsu]